MAESRTEETAVPEGEAPPAKPRKDWGKYWRRRIAAGILGLLALIGLGAVLLDSPIGHRFIADSLSSYAPASGLRIDIGRIDGSILDEATLHDVVVSDTRGVFLRVPVVELKWDPYKWFSTGLDVDYLIARRGHLLRLPELNPGDPDAPILPNFDIRIGRLEIESLLVDEAVAGFERRIDVLASADIADGRAKVNLRSNLGGEDRLYARLDASEAENLFDLEFDYRAPAGGLLAEMIGSSKDTRAIVSGEGTWTDWKGRAVVRQDGENLAAFRLAKGPDEYRVLGQVYPADMLTGLPAKAVGRALSVRFAGNLEDSVVTGRFNLAGAAFKANGQGAVDLDGNEFVDLAMTARLTDPDLLGNGTRAEGLFADLTLDGSFRDLAVDYAVRAERVQSGETLLAGVRSEGTARWVGGRLTLPLEATAQRIRTGNAMLDPRLTNARLSGTIVYDGNSITSQGLTLNSSGLQARLAMQGDIGAGTYRFAGPVAANNVMLEGLGTASGRATINALIGGPAGWSLRAEVAGNLTNVTNATLAEYAGSPIAFDAQIALAANRPVLVRNARLKSSLLTMTVSGERALDGTVRLTGSGRHARFGPFDIDGTIDGTGPNVRLVLDDPLPGAGLRNVNVAISPTEDGFDIVTDGQSLLGPFAGTIGLATLPDGTNRLTFRDFTVSNTGVAGEVLLVRGGAQGELALSGGGVDGTLSLNPTDAGQAVDADVVLRDARFEGDVPITVRSARIDAQGILGASPNLTVSVNAQGVQRGSLFIGRLAGRGDYHGERGSFVAEVAGRRGSRFALRTIGEITPERIAVAAKGRYGGRPITMPQYAVLTKVDGGWQLQRSQVDFAGGRFQAEGVLANQTSMTVRMTDMPLSVTNLFLGDLGIGGTASGVVSFQDSGTSPATGSVRLLLDDFTRSGLVLTSRPMDIALVGELTTTDMEARAVIREGGDRKGRIQMRVTQLAQSGGFPERIRNGRLFAQARYAGPADALWRLTGIEYFDLTGPVEIAGDANGTLDNPRVRGTLKADDLRMQSTLTGTNITGISARGAFDGSVLRLTRFSGTAANGGTVSGSGSIDLTEVASTGVDMDIRVAARNALLLNRDDLKATVTGPLRIVATDNVGTIAGRLDLVSGNWALGTADPAQSLPNIEIIEKNLPADRQVRQARTAPWRYLIDVSANNRFEVEGMGLESEWAADVQVRGTTAAPRLLGEAEVVRGAYSFAGKRFDLERGRIRFSGEDPPDPRLDIVAVADINDINARVAITGTAETPRIAFTSVPALPEEEVLSRLLFGDSVSNISALEALQLGAALSSMQGGGGGFDPINSLRNSIGLDRLRVIGADEALGRGTSVAVGEYLGRNFYVELVTDGQGYSATELEFRVTSWLSFLATVSTLNYNSVEAEVSKDY